MKVAGFVLTGGRSRRMGRDKALLEIGGQTMCEHLGDIAAAVAERVLLVGHPERYSNLKYECVADAEPGLGPLSGIDTALGLQLAEYSIVLSCDAVNVSTEWLRALLLKAEDTGTACVVAEDADGQIQPLCGVYRQACRPLVRKALEEGRLRLLELVRELGAATIRVDERILNLNTPAEYEELAYGVRKK